MTGELIRLLPGALTTLRGLLWRDDAPSWVTHKVLGADPKRVASLFIVTALALREVTGAPMTSISYSKMVVASGVRSRDRVFGERTGRRGATGHAAIDPAL
jgi:hypothetical protein